MVIFKLLHGKSFLMKPLSKEAVDAFSSSEQLLSSDISSSIS
jgi:hypothetical protein